VSDWVSDSDWQSNFEQAPEVSAALRCVELPEISGLSTHAIQPLIREPDEETREKAISSVSKWLFFRNRLNAETFSIFVNRDHNLFIISKYGGESTKG